MLGDVGLGKGSLRRSGQVVYRRAVRLDSLHDCGRDFVSRSVGEADVEDSPAGGQRCHLRSGGELTSCCVLSLQQPCPQPFVHQD